MLPDGRHSHWRCYTPYGCILDSSLIQDFFFLVSGRFLQLLDDVLAVCKSSAVWKRTNQSNSWFLLCCVCAVWAHLGFSCNLSSVNCRNTTQSIMLTSNFGLNQIRCSQFYQFHKVKGEPMTTFVCLSLVNKSFCNLVFYKQKRVILSDKGSRSCRPP